jgi:hypothetical protein
MARKDIHIHIHGKTNDEVKHAPAGSSQGGQFTSGSGGGGSGKAKNGANKTTGKASYEHEDLKKYHAHVSTNSPKSQVSWASVAKEAHKALTSGKLSNSEKEHARTIYKEATGKATTLPPPPVPNVGAYAHLTKPVSVKPTLTKPASVKPTLTNVGTAKHPLQAPTSSAVWGGHASGSTHYIAGFQPPANGGGDHVISHNGEAYTHTGKSGANLKTGEASHEYAAGNSGEKRAWVTKSGYLKND